MASEVTCPKCKKPAAIHSGTRGRAKHPVFRLVCGKCRHIGPWADTREAAVGTPSTPSKGAK